MNIYLIIFYRKEIFRQDFKNNHRYFLIHISVHYIPNAYGKIIPNGILCGLEQTISFPVKKYTFSLHSTLSEMIQD